MAIMLVGFFLRTYNFHEWLKFRDDQARDAMLTSQAVAGKIPWPLTGPYMSYSGDGNHVETNSFHLGPAYYYMQIISSKIFGNYADKAAYPDVFFGILSIILLYAFLRIYFEKNISLGLAGLYAVSAYFIQYSRFAWNTNLIPFFVLLLLFSLHKFLDNNEKTPWLWVVLVGVALGIGVQLHAIVMLIFLIVVFAVFLFSMIKNYKAWMRWAVILIVFLALNAPQVFTEIKTNFSNTKILFNFSSHDGNEIKVDRLTLIKNDIDCNIEANSFFLSSYGSSNCTYDFLTPSVYGQVRRAKIVQDLTLRVAMLAGILFSILGYYLLIRYGRKETGDSKKYFLYLTGLYIIVSFVLMLPLSVDKFNDLRYLTPTFFVPYVLLGFIIKFLAEKITVKHAVYLIGVIFLVLIYTNASDMAGVVSDLIAGDRTCSSRSTTIGELEPVAEYMISNSNGAKTLYFGGDKAFRVAYGPLAYILEKHGIDSKEIGADTSSPQSNGPAYIVSCKSGRKELYPYQAVGSINVFRLK